MEKFSLDRDWKFYNGDFELPETKTHTECYMAAKAGGAIGAASPDFDKSDWETVNLPHDWAVYNEFEEKWGDSPLVMQKYNILYEIVVNELGVEL